MKISKENLAIGASSLVILSGVLLFPIYVKETVSMLFFL